MAKTKTQAPAVVEEDVKLCGCGCGEAVNPKRSYKAGHDARHCGRLLKAHDQGDKDATAMLLAKGWRSQFELDQRDEKAAKKAMNGKTPATDPQVKDDVKEDVA